MAQQRLGQEPPVLSPRPKTVMRGRCRLYRSYDLPHRLDLAGIIGSSRRHCRRLIYLLVTQPVSTAENLANGEVSPLVRAVGAVLYDALRGILKFL